MSYELRRTYEPDTWSQPDITEWFGRVGSEEGNIALTRLDAFLQKHCKGTRLHHTPTGAGQAALQRMLPEHRSYPQLDDETQRLIRAWSFPHRHELLHSPGRKPLIEYDARVAYAACCADVPCFFLTQEGNHYDLRHEFLGYRKVFYTVDVTVPSGWEHIGLVPKRPELRAKDWLYPNRPGEEWQAHLWECEVQLLEDHGWPFAVRERHLFAEDAGTATTDPLRAWVSQFNKFLEEGALPAGVTGKLVRRGLRNMVINTTGSFHGMKTWRPLDDDTPLGVERNFNRGEWQYASYAPLSDRRGMWNHPEWSSHIWAKSRVKSTKQALQVPYKHLIEIKADAITMTTDPRWVDTRKVGAFRRKAG